MVISEVVKFLLFISFGYLSMWLLHKQPLSLILAKAFDKAFKTKWFEGLLECYLCLGVWVFSVLSYLFRFTIITVGISVLDWLFTGIIASFVGYLLFRGWQSEFTEIVIGR